MDHAALMRGRDGRREALDQFGGRLRRKRLPLAAFGERLSFDQPCRDKRQSIARADVEYAHDQRVV
ncbi:MAG: hypothetical protein U0939_21110 [Pirellulales bacterium]